MTNTLRQEPRTGRPLVSDELWDRVVFNITREHGLQESEAERLLDQALIFMDLVGTQRIKLAPSQQVDKAWHAFILHTIDYRKHCAQHYGTFIEHVPHERDRKGEPGAIARSRRMLTEAGYAVDDELWTGESDCNGQCSGNCGPE